MYIYTSAFFYITIIAITSLYLLSVTIIKKIVNKEKYNRELTISIILVIYISYIMLYQIWNGTVFYLT